MEFCPILVQIKSEIIKKDYACEYFLQVWNQQGSLIYQVPLKRKQLFLITSKIAQMCGNFIAYNNGVLYIANFSTLYLVQASFNVEDSQIERREIQKNQVQKVSISAVIHGIFIMIQKKSTKKGDRIEDSKIIIALETDDNQLDFSEIVPENLGSEKFKFVLKQQRESVTRFIKFDRITKFSFITDYTNNLYGVSLRESGGYDLYWDMVLINYPTAQQIAAENYASGSVDIAVDVFSSFDTLYIKFKSGIIKQIRTTGSQGNFNPTDVDIDNFDCSMIFYQNIKEHAHGHYLSLYDIQDHIWVRHIKFEEGDIHKIFKKPIKTSNGQIENEILVLLSSGSVYDNMFEFIQKDQKAQDSQNESLNSSSMQLGIQAVRQSSNDKKWKQLFQAKKILVIEQQQKKFKLPGRVLRTSYDSQKNQWIYVMTKEADKIRWFAISEGKPQQINEDNGSKPFDENSQVLHVSVPYNQESHILIQNRSRFSLYQISISEPLITSDEFETNPAQSISDQIITLNLIVRDQNKKMTGQIHSCFTKDITDHILFMDNHNLYTYQLSKKKFIVYENQKCVGTSIIDTHFCYALNHSGDNGVKLSGLRLYDINSIIQKHTDLSFHLSNIMVGQYSKNIDWNQDYSRLTLLKSLDELIIIPALHRNTIAFIGIEKRDEYLATRVIKDQFIALNKQGYLFCWNIATGKLDRINKLPSRQDYSGFQIFSSDLVKEDDLTYKRGWTDKILLMRKNPELNPQQKKRNQSQMTLNTPIIKNQISYSDQQVKEIREFRLIEIISDHEVIEHIIFTHPLYINQSQHLHIDSRIQFMIEKLTYPRVFLYQKESLGAKMVVWKLVRRFNFYPWNLDSVYLRPFSPSYLYFIDIKQNSNQFIVKDTWNLKEIYTIPIDLMQADSTQGGNKIEEIMNRFKWEDDDKIKIINKEGVEKIVDLTKNCEEIDFNVIPLFDNGECKKPGRNYYHNREPLPLYKVKGRLKRKYQIYKSSYYLHHKSEPHELYNDLFTVDYQVDNCKGIYVADLSFSFLHWKIMEKLEHQQLSIDQIDETLIALLCYNILPGGNTILHMLNENSEVLDKVFQMAHPNEDNISEIQIHIPFLPNFEGKSPMHLCKERQDLRPIDTMLTYLSGYGFDHHSRAITDLYPFFIEKQLPSLLQYLDSRLQQNDRLKDIKKGCLRNKKKSIIDSQIWFKESDLYERLMKNSKEGELVERPIKVEIIDLPKLYDYNEEISEEFFSSLADTDQYKIFEKKVIKKLIEFNYPLVKKYTIKKLFLPFVIFQASLFIYLNVIFGQESPILQQLDLPAQLVLGVFACYFLRNEFYQMKKQGFEYLHSIWNYFDIVTPTIILTIMLINITSIHLEANIERALQAIGVFFMWFKFLYFFRIFKNFGYLTRLIQLVIYDMRHFLVVLFFTIVAFGDSFLTLSNGNETDQRFVNGFTDSIIYTYRIILGDFDVGAFGAVNTAIVLVLFILCTVFNTIVMLNLLIAIISETFTMVKENSQNASYQEMASMIAENSYLIPAEIKSQYSKKNRYLMFVTDLEDEDQGDQDEFVKHIDKLSKKMKKQMSASSKAIKELMAREKKREEWENKMEKNQERIIKMLASLSGNSSPNKKSEDHSKVELESTFINNPRPSANNRPVMKSFEPQQEGSDKKGSSLHLNKPNSSRGLKF